MSRRRTNLVIAGIALAVAIAAAIVFAIVSLSGGSSTTGSSAAQVTAGQAIFQSGVDANGALIPRSSGASSGGMMGGGGMGGGMMRRGCSGCHGSDGRGRTTPTFTAPNITYPNLTDPKGMLAPDGSRGPTYTDAAIRTAVTQGVDPTGAQLHQPMPRWQLTDQEWADLLAYLKTLH